MSVEEAERFLGTQVRSSGPVSLVALGAALEMRLGLQKVGVYEGGEEHADVEHATCLGAALVDERALERREGEAIPGEAREQRGEILLREPESQGVVTGEVLGFPEIAERPGALESDVMALCCQGYGGTGLAKLSQRRPGAGRPVVEAALKPFQPAGEPFTVFAEVVQQAGDPRFVGGTERGGEEGRAVRDVREMIAKGLPTFSSRGGVGEVHVC